MSYAIPGQRPRPGLDAALDRLEEQAKECRCEVCGKEDPLLRWTMTAYWDGHAGTLSVLHCPDCAKARNKR